MLADPRRALLHLSLLVLARHPDPASPSSVELRPTSILVLARCDLRQLRRASLNLEGLVEPRPLDWARVRSRRAKKSQAPRVEPGCLEPQKGTLVYPLHEPDTRPERFTTPQLHI